jgi:glucose/arabinose dehydrogenase
MMRRCLGLVLALTLACAESPGGPAEPRPATQSRAVTLSLQLVAQGLASPVFLTAPGRDSRLFVLEQVGRIRVIENGVLLPTPFLDITTRVGSGGERGLLGLAFHPRFDDNCFFYVNYTDKSGNTRIERYRVTTDRNRVDTLSSKLLLSIAQPFANHNGGMLAFGPDGMLYIGMGDGGSGGDPQGHGQNMNSLLGKILRIDVDRGDPYGIPAGNPFVGQAGRRGEIWASGVRNPWRFAFDPAGGMLYVADVGQNTNEEINVVPASAAGVNYGWNRMEAKHCFPATVTSCDQTGLQVPQVEYPRSQGISVTGGYVYRGRAIPSLVGHYFYADFGQPGIRSFRFADGRVQDERRWELPEATSVSSFGQDSEGELYVVSLGGRVFKIVPA